MIGVTSIILNTKLTYCNKPTKMFVPYWNEGHNLKSVVLWQIVGVKQIVNIDVINAVPNDNYGDGVDDDGYDIKKDDINYIIEKDSNDNAVRTGIIE